MKETMSLRALSSYERGLGFKGLGFRGFFERLGALGVSGLVR